MKILVVDDEENARLMAETVLGSQGYTVTTCSDGQEALNAVRDNPPDLVVTDILMPVMDGFALCRAIKEDTTLCSIPVVFYTATYVSASDEQFAMTLGASRFIIKPLEIDQFIAIINETIENHHGRMVPVPNLLDKSVPVDRLHAESLSRKLFKKAQDLEQERGALKTSEEKYRSLLMSMGEGVYGLDTDGNCTFCNPACLNALGYSEPADLLGKNIHQLIHHHRSDNSPYPENKCPIYMAFLQGKGVHVDDEVLFRADGSSFPVEYHSHPIEVDGTITGAVVLFTDITKRKKAEAAVQESEQQKRIILE
jgi:PAS domain S-box-containing protein